jgi:hypothetical protein
MIEVEAMEWNLAFDRQQNERFDRISICLPEDVTKCIEM